MTEVTITDRDRQILNLVARGEATAGGNPYISLYSNTTLPGVTDNTIAEVLRFQEQRSNKPAIGRYQFKPNTLRECAGYLGVDPARTRFTPDVQDALILARLKVFRQMDQWYAGTLPTDRFMIKLAQEFSSMPVPYAMTKPNPKPNGTRLQKGESYYSKNNIDRSKVDPGPDDPDRIQKREAGTDTLYQELEDIRTGGTGGSKTIPVNADGPSGALPLEGTTPKAQTINRAAGLGVGAYVGGNAGARPLVSTVLPGATGAVYQYRTIDPLDDRYDFRTGEKIKDLSIHGTAAAAQTPIVNGNIGPARVATTNSGVETPIPAPEVSASLLPQTAEIQSGISDALGTISIPDIPSVGDLIGSLPIPDIPSVGDLIGNILPDPTSIIANIAERARSLFDNDALNSALTGGRTTSVDTFDSAITRPESATNTRSSSSANAGSVATPPAPVTTSTPSLTSKKSFSSTSTTTTTVSGGGSTTTKISESSLDTKSAAIEAAKSGFYRDLSSAERKAGRISSQYGVTLTPYQPASSSKWRLR